MSSQVPESFMGNNQILASTYKQQAYTLIKDAILYRRLKIGTVYSQDGLCTELGISRTPVREALLELQQEGYINFMRGKGIEIVPITHKEAEDIIEMRGVIELAGSILAAKRATAQQVEAIYRSLAEMRAQSACNDAATMYKLDRQFHISIFEAAGNCHLLSSVEMLRDQFLRLETLDAFDTAEKYKQVLCEHEDIYNGIAAHDPEKARAGMLYHLQATYERTVKKALASLA